MSIFKRGRVYWFHFWFEGQHIQRSTRQGNPRVARQIEAAYRTHLAKGSAGIHVQKRPPLFADSMRDFLSWSQSEHLAHPRTHSRYETSSVALLKYFKGVRLDEVTSEALEKFKAVRAQQYGTRTHRILRPATINRELACGKAMFNHAIKCGTNLRNPFSSVRFLAEQNEQTRVLTYQEERAYLDVASQPLRDIFILMKETGMRPEEAYCLRRENVRLEQSSLVIPFGKTKAARRRVHLTKEAHEMLRRRMETTKGCYLFPHLKDCDKPMLKVNNAHLGALKRSRVAKFRLYDVRHTWATRAAMAGIDLVTLAAMLGHSRIQMVLRYVHPTERHQAEATRQLEKFNADRQLAEYQQNDRLSLQFSLQ